MIINVYTVECILFFSLYVFGATFMKISSAVHQVFPNFPGGMASLAAIFNRSQYQFPSSHV